jgi:hypothetical protein
MIPLPAALHTGRLVLAPVDPLQATDRTTIVKALTALRLLGEPQGGDSGVFAAGPALGDLVGFTGCAVQFDAATDDANAGGRPWLRIPPKATVPRLLWGRNTRPPRCPNCSAPLRGWRDRLPPDPAMTASQPGCDASLRLRCDVCLASSAAYRWKWGRHAGAGRSFVLIEEVFPGEGTPLPGLLQDLAALGAGPWAWFYVQD